MDQILTQLNTCRLDHKSDGQIFAEGMRRFDAITNNSINIESEIILSKRRYELLYDYINNDIIVTYSVEEDAFLSDVEKLLRDWDNMIQDHRLAEIRRLDGFIASYYLNGKQHHLVTTCAVSAT